MSETGQPTVRRDDQLSHPGSAPGFIVGIGASAGGLDALETLFENIQKGLGVAYVVVQHLSPDFKSHMVELLARKTSLAVHHVTDGVEVMADNIYLIPPNKEMIIADAKLLLTERDASSGLNHPIDQFLRSLATDCGRSAIGIILSGTGSDGANGVVAIRDSGGLVLSQDDETAQFDGMPLSAVATGAVHVSLPPDAMFEAIYRYVEEGLSPDSLAKEDFHLIEEGIDRVFQLIRSSSGVDFTHYKSTTVGRRLQRRMEMANIRDLPKYCALLEEDPIELDGLFQDMLIGVTRFFRDAPAFEIMEQQVIPELIAHAKNNDQPIRIWVPGCASGEEPYSLAMLIDEQIQREQIDIEWKIFATDIHSESLRTAAAGVYPAEALGEISDRRRGSYFSEHKDGFHIAKHLREHILFAPQNLLSDAPFIQIDLITCRNLLIYFQPNAQKKALALFHFALRPNGFMVLGPSETPGELAEEFETLDSKWRVYSKTRDIRIPFDTRLPMGVGYDRPELPRGSNRKTGAASVSADAQLLRVYDRLLDRSLPATVLVDQNYEIVHTFSGAQRFLKVRPGRMSNNLLDMIDEGIKTPISGAVQHAKRENKEVSYTGLRSSDPDEPPLRLSVLPIIDPGTKALHFAIEFEESPQRDALRDPDVDVDMDEMTRERVGTLETELQFTRENLQATIEELETANEELQATNEEMLASNEELQSTNEELQSVNEELYTVNSEHQKKIEELAESNSDMDNLLASTRVGVVYLDAELCIRRFTPEVSRVLHLMPQDIGRSLASFVSVLRGQTLIDDCREALSEDRELEREFEHQDGTTYLVRTAPYRTSSDTEGVVMTLVDISSIKATQNLLEDFQHLSRQSVDGHLLVDDSGSISYCNPALLADTGYEESELVGENIKLLDEKLDHRGLKRLFAKLEPGVPDRSLTPIRRRDGTPITVEVVYSVVELGSGHRLFAVMRDVSEREQALQDLALYNRAIDVSINGITIAEAKPGLPLIYVNEGFVRLSGYRREEVLGQNCRFLQGPDTDPAVVAELSDALRQAKAVRVVIRNYRKDGQSFWNDLSMNPVFNDKGEVTHFVGVQNDVTETTDQRLELEQRSAEIGSLLGATSDGILGIDTGGNCSFCNESAVEMLGYQDDDELVGRNAHSLMHHSHSDGTTYPESECPITASIRNGYSSRRDNEVFWRADRSSFAVEYSCDPIQVAGRVVGSVLTFRNTEQKRRQIEATEAARLAAEQASRAKSEFLASMSHEIRTPLTAVMGFVDVLHVELSDQQQLQHLATIKRNVYYLLDIINDILDLSKIEADRIDEALHLVDLPKLVGDLQSVFAIRAAEKSLEFHVDYETEIPQEVMSNATHLRQILLNLLANAMKFTEAGRIDLLVAANPDAQLVTVRVRDTGLGMSVDTQRTLFEPFTRGEEVPTHIGGTGLGLNISRRLADRLGGELSVDSRLGEGSTFQLTFPMGDVPEVTFVRPSVVMEVELPQSGTTPSEDYDFGGVTVLVVDDEPDIRDFVSHVLKDSSASVVAVDHGQKALDVLVERHPQLDLVVLDMQLPGLTGFEVAREARRMGVTVPIVAVTAGAMKGERERCLGAGCEEFLAKPVERTALLEVASRLLQSSDASASCRVLVVEDHIDASVAISAYLTGMGYDVRIAGTGSEARSLFHGFAPQVCIIDQNLPDELGTELVRSFTREATGLNTLFIAASGLASTHDRRNFEKAGFDVALSKPLDMSELVSLIEVFLADGAVPPR